MFNLLNLESADLSNKKVFVRCDFDVPLNGSEVADDSRLVSAISTIEYLLEKGATVISAGHLGRPSGTDPKFSLEPVAKWFADEFPDSNIDKTNVGEFDAWKIKDNFYVLENLRFFDGEEGNDPDFAANLAQLADVYVNEAFGSSHRSHASIVGICSLLPHFAGFHFQKEVKVLSTAIDDPKRPLVVIIGGAKIETKQPLVSKMTEIADYILVGGEIVEKESEISEKIIVADLTDNNNDIDNKSVEKFKEIISGAGMIIWNGPMGNLEKGFTDSTLNLAKAIENSSAYKIVGGGDTIAFLNKHEMVEKFNFVSVGGGAMLEFLSGENLPGIVSLQK